MAGMRGRLIGGASWMEPTSCSTLIAQPCSVRIADRHSPGDLISIEW